MSTAMKRFSVSATPEMMQVAEELKKSAFYNKTYAEMYRQILIVGLDATKAHAPPDGKD